MPSGVLLLLALLPQVTGFPAIIYLLYRLFFPLFYLPGAPQRATPSGFTWHQAPNPISLAFGPEVLSKTTLSPPKSSRARCPGASPAALTQAVHAERCVIEEVADVPGAGGHGAEGVGAAGSQGVDAAGQQVGKKRPGVGVLGAPRPPQPPHQGPHKVPGGGGGEHRARRVPSPTSPGGTYQAGTKWVQMLSVSLVIWKTLRRQSAAELRGGRYPQRMPCSW